MDKVRIGVIGVGGMGYSHSKAVKSLADTELTCVSDTEKAVAKEKGEEFGVGYFTDYRELIKSGLCDAVIVATPHWIHPEVSVFAFENGLHVLSEKPLAVTVSGADEMIDAAKRNKKVFAVMYQRRTEPAIRKAIEIVKSGILGEIQRTLLVNPDFRPQAYYDSGIWRATWLGEGGGVLINQAPHGIDIFMRLGGLPVRVEAKTRTKLHKIEVEDEASAFLEYGNGAWGYYYTSTCEGCGGLHLELAGDKGKLVLKGEELKLYRFSQPVSEFSVSSEDMWAVPEVKEEDVELPSDVAAGHSVIIENFARAILHGELLVAPGEDGLRSVEFINALILSGRKGKCVEIPVDRTEYDGFIEEMKKTSKPKEVVNVKRITDPRASKSYRNYSGG